MGSLILSSEIAAFQQAVNDHFDTFKREITVHKEPIKNIVQTTTNQMLGYQEDSNIVDYTYTPRSQNFYAIIKYNIKGENLPIDNELKLRFPDQFVEIKVQEDAKNYINQDKTEKVTFDNKAFNIVSSSVVKNYLGLSYYVYYLKETN